MDDPLLVGVLDRLADRHKQLQPLPRGQLVIVAILGDRHAVDQLHDEIRQAGFGGPNVEDAGDVDVVHHGQGLPLGLEAGDDLAAVHARLDDLERDLALHGVGLLRHVDRAHAAFADLLQDLIRTDDRTEAHREVRLVDRGHNCPRVVQELLWFFVSLQKGLDLGAERLIAGAGLIEERGPLGRGTNLDGREKNRLLRMLWLCHRKLARQTVR